MIEFSLRADMLERELLSRHTAPSLAAIDSRQIEAFRVGAAIHVTDPAWKLWLEKWSRTGALTYSNVTELETWNDENLYNLIIRQEAPQTIRQDAALELYRRASKFVQTPEFATFLTMCIDRELVERKAGHEPSRVLDALWRINEKMEMTKAALAQSDTARREAEKALMAALERAMQMVRSEANAQGVSLQQAVKAVRKTIRQHALFLGSATFLTALASCYICSTASNDSVLTNSASHHQFRNTASMLYLPFADAAGALLRALLPPARIRAPDCEWLSA